MRLVRKPDARDGWYEISPAEAQKLLECGMQNRPLSEFRAATIAADIQSGRWRANGESIIFNPEGRLLDGQTRLRGIVLANQPVESFCVFGVPDSVFASLDQGKARGGSDLAALMEFTNYSTVASTVRLIIEYQDGTLAKTGKAGMPQELLRLYLKRNRALLSASVSHVVSYRKGIVGLIPISHACLVYHIARVSHPKEAEEFIEKLATGTDLKKGDSLLLFRERLKGLNGMKHVLTQVEKLALLIKSWNAFFSKRPIGVLKWNRDVEQFPKIEL